MHIDNSIEADRRGWEGIRRVPRSYQSQWSRSLIIGGLRFINSDPTFWTTREKKKPPQAISPGERLKPPLLGSLCLYTLPCRLYLFKIRDTKAQSRYSTGVQSLRYTGLNEMNFVQLEQFLAFVTLDRRETSRTSMLLILSNLLSRFVFGGAASAMKLSLY